MMEVVALPSAASQAGSPFHTGHHTWHEGRARYTAYLAKLVGSLTAGPVLDVGCGIGHLLSALAARRIPATGFDISRDAVVHARRDPHVNAFQHDASETWPFPDQSFDAVTMFDVIEHVMAYERVLDEAQRVLRPNGSLLIVTVNRSSILHFLLGHAWGALKDPEHVTYFDRRRLTSAVEAAGFEVREIRTVFNFSVAGESAGFLRALRVPGLMLFIPEFGDSIYARAQRLP